PIILGEKLSFDPFPLQSPDSAPPSVLIAGAGVSDLVTSWVLLDRGYDVTIVSKDFASFTNQQRLTSQIAGALWEFPPAVCGQHTDLLSLKKSKHRCMEAYHIWAAIASDPKLAALAGVQMRSSNFFSLARHGIDPRYGAVDAYEHLAPVIDTDQCMKWLMLLVETKGAKFQTETITHGLFTQEELLDRFSADVIINCTGLSALSLASDKTCYPLRGALIRVINDGKDFPKVESSLAVTADAARDNKIVFIVPRNDNILLIGGIKRMRARVEAFLPSLKNARVNPEYPIAQGLRPARETNIRVERELRTRSTLSHGVSSEEASRIIHNYGHGGSGWSLSFGCAADVASLVEEVLHNLPASEMKLRQKKKVVLENVQLQPLGDHRIMEEPIRARL
ncbi:MAG: hypothetical protein Q9182_007420, partial [Xanthomendoza sp. 2 TL-2023]